MHGAGLHQVLEPVYEVDRFFALLESLCLLKAVPEDDLFHSGFSL